jgi:hypothetical protein
MQQINETPGTGGTVREGRNALACAEDFSFTEIKPDTQTVRYRSRFLGWLVIYRDGRYSGFTRRGETIGRHNTASSAAVALLAETAL